MDNIESGDSLVEMLTVRWKAVLMNGFITNQVQAVESD